jgi:hypothetical protein
MQRTGKLKMPLQLLVLDALGAVLLGLGLAEWFGGTNLVPESLRFDNYYIAMVVCGALLMLPLVAFVLRTARGRAPREI